MAPDIHRLIGQHENALEAEFGGQVSPVAVCDVGVLLEEGGDLFIGVQSYSLRYEHRPVVVTAQLHVVGRLQQLLRHLQQHLVHVALSQGRQDAKALLYTTCRPVRPNPHGSRVNHDLQCTFRGQNTASTAAVNENVRLKMIMITQ